jgi:hypothetical protein
MFALLERPLGFVPVSESELKADSTLGRLCAASPRLDQAAGLRALLEASAHHEPQARAALVADIDVCPGEAAARMRAAVYDLLGLAPRGCGTEPRGTEPRENFGDT